MLTVITPTGYREAQFRLLEKYMDAQDVQEEVRWIIVNDGPALERKSDFGSQESRLFNVDSRHIKGPTLGFNTRVALDYIDRLGDFPTRIIIMEDDVWYAPNYITFMAALMRKADIVGTAPAWVYNVAARKYKLWHSRKHASWSETCVSGLNACTYLYGVCGRAGTMLDMNMWLKHPGMRKHRTTDFLLQLEKPLAVSMKGHGQARTLGKGHVPADVAAWESDADLSVLRSWIGSAVENYYPKDQFPGPLMGGSKAPHTNASPATKS